MAITINPATAEIAVGASQDFVFSGRVGAEYFVDLPIGADKATLTKINSTTWRVTRNAVGNISIRGSESPFGDNHGRVIGNDDGQTTLNENGTQTLAHLNAATVYSYLTTKLTAIGQAVKVKGTPLSGSNGTSFQVAASSAWGGAGWLNLNDANSEWKIEKSGADKVKYYKDNILQGSEITTAAGDISIIFAMAPANSNLGYVIPRWEFTGAVSHYSEAIATIGLPPLPINIDFTVPLSVNDGQALIPENLTTNATGFEWRVNNVLRSTAFEPDLHQWLNVGANEIKLTATNPAYTSNLTKTVTLNAPGQVDFLIPEIEKGKAFHLTNLSTNAQSYLIDFGDGVTSANPEINHVYLESGTKTITLTAQFINVSIMRSKDVYVYIEGLKAVVDEIKLKSQWNIFPMLIESEILDTLKSYVTVDSNGNIATLWDDRTSLKNKVIADLWLIKSAKASAQIETTGIQYRNANQQIYEHCLEMARVYGDKEMGTFVNLAPN